MGEQEADDYLDKNDDSDSSDQADSPPADDYAAPDGEGAPTYGDEEEGRRVGLREAGVGHRHGRKLRAASRS
jgi:hypothetical protein